LDAAEYCAAGGSGKGVSSRIDRQCPNIAIRSNQPSANFTPTFAIVCRAEYSACSASKDVAQRVDGHCAHINRRKTIILFRPAVTVVSGSEHAATLTEYGMSSGKDVTVAFIDRQRRDVGGC
jgi:hypothetical protein